MNNSDIVIIGAGAAGLMCAIEAGKRGRHVIVLDHANKPGKKILMSGGGRCNFTNYTINADNFISHNPHFCKSALSRYTQWDFIELVKKYQIPFHEKTLGQLFCDNKSKDILEMLLAECQRNNVEIKLNTSITKIENPNPHYFKLTSNDEHFDCQSLVIASGGLSIPTMGASPFGYKVAEQFNIPVWPTRAGLVPLTLQIEDREKFSQLSGVAVDCLVSNQRNQFRENILFTHRGLSGPAILQISSYWQPGETIHINLLPEIHLANELTHHSQDKQLKTVLSEYLPKRIIEIFLNTEFAEKKIRTLTQENIKSVCLSLQNWVLKPNGTEGYRTAEVTLGGVDCDKISSKTMEALHVPGLYFIGEVLDVSGWLGGYNFQWAWSSGWAAGQVV
ncbi:MAG: NAD(P)/FAD-dependent oxidoreductase [Gammaproteobacteria bacterium]|nr:NAD(P)/FAD-dependent oxidoreductase [Gammaproteobacteria bacterium]